MSSIYTKVINNKLTNTAKLGNTSKDGTGDHHHLVVSRDGHLKSVNNKIEPNDKVKLTSADGISVYADTLPVPAVDTNDRSGWLFHKVVDDATKFNYYIYGSTGSSHQFTLTDLKSAYMVGSIDKYDNTSSIPFIVVYSKPTGVGDAGVWYHSKRTYSIDMSTEKILVGEQVNLYFGTKPVLKNDNRYIELKTYSTEGDNLDTEEILAVSIHSDSASLIGTKILISDVGYNLKDEIERNIKLVV